MSNHVLEKGPWPFEMNYLPEVFLEKAKRELNETPENKMTCLHDLKKLIENNKSLSEVDLHPDLLQLFLRHSKYNTQKAFTRLQNYIHFRRNHSSYFKPIPYEVAKSKFGNAVTILPWRTPDGCVVSHFQYGNFEDNKTDLDEFERLILTLSNQSLRQQMSQLNGYKGIHDCKNLTLKKVRLATPRRMYMLIQAYTNCLPGRIKEIHIINEPYVLKLFTQMLKPILPEKFSKRFFFHSRPQDLLKYFPSYAVPEKYGGSLKECCTPEFTKLACEEQSVIPLGGQPNFS